MPKVVKLIKPSKTRASSKKLDATHQREMAYQILAIDQPSGYTFDEALRIVVPHDANDDHCAHCHLFQKAWNSLVRKGYLAQVTR
jgi:hypothetical protein